MSIRSTLKPPHLAAAAAFGSGLLVHLFGLVNVLHNYDDIAQQPRGYGTGVTSGRWLLSIMGDFCDAIGGNFNLPTVNGLLFLLLIAVSAGLLVSVFRIRNRASAALMGVLFAVFPSAFSTLAFRYTAVYYGVAILLSVSALFLGFLFVRPLHCLLFGYLSGLCSHYHRHVRLDAPSGVSVRRCGLPEASAPESGLLRGSFARFASVLRFSEAHALLVWDAAE